MRKRIIAGILLILVPLILGLRARYQYVRSKDYVFEHLAPVCEEEVEAFFYDNKEEFLTLAQQFNELENSDYCSYTLQSGEEERADLPLPDEMKDVLEEIEETTGARYVVDFYANEIQVLTTPKTNFDICLGYWRSEEELKQSLNPDHDRLRSLEGGWYMKTTYVIRG